MSDICEIIDNILFNEFQYGDKPTMQDSALQAVLAEAKSTIENLREGSEGGPSDAIRKILRDKTSSSGGTITPWLWLLLEKIDKRELIVLKAGNFPENISLDTGAETLSGKEAVVYYLADLAF